MKLITQSTRRAALPIAAVLAVVAMTQPARAQQDDTFTQFLSGTTLPLKLQMKDLTPAFRRIVVGGQNDSMSTWLQMVGVAKGVLMNVYFTKGKTVTLGGETYLIAYRPQTPIDPDLLNGHTHGAPVEQPKPTATTTLALSLLNLRTSGSLNDVRPFDPKQDIQTPDEANAASVRTLQALGQGVLSYVYSHNNKLPRMGAAVTPQLTRSLYPFVHDQRALMQPSTQELYRPNPMLSEKKINDIVNRQLLPLFAEARPAADGTRGVLFLDGHVERVTEDRWERLQKVTIVRRPVVRQPNRAAQARVFGSPTR